MTENRKIMLSALKEHVFPKLKEAGFTGKYPHFRRKREDRVDLISFQSNKYGGSFTVEISTAFLNGEDKNYTLYGDMTEDTLNVSATNERYRLPGMFDGRFYYSDVYKKTALFFGTIYTNIPAGDNITDLNGFRLVQPFDENTAKLVCTELNEQLIKAFVWLEDFAGKHI